MAKADDTRREKSFIREDDDLSTSSFELKLAASVISRVVKRNGNCEAADLFWEDDALDSLEEKREYQDPELWDPDEETLPEAKEIEWNLYPCN